MTTTEPHDEAHRGMADLAGLRHHLRHHHGWSDGYGLHWTLPYLQERHEAEHASWLGNQAPLPDELDVVLAELRQVEARAWELRSRAARIRLERAAFREGDAAILHGRPVQVETVLAGAEDLMYEVRFRSPNGRLGASSSWCSEAALGKPT